MAALLRERASAVAAAAVPLALRGSSMGGYLALVVGGGRRRPTPSSRSARRAPSSLLRGLRDGGFEFAADVPALEALLAAHDRRGRGRATSRCPLLLLHAEGDERVPVDHSRALYAAAGPARARLLVLPGGHHRSIQHDAELQGESLRFVRRAFADATPR